MALIGSMKYLTIGDSTYEIQGQEITSSAITSALGYTPYNGSTNPNGYITSFTDTKVSTAAVSTNGTYYYPIVGSDTTAAATKYYDKTGFTYHVSSQASTLTLGNSTATSSSDGRSGKIIIKGTGTTGVSLVTDNSGTESGNYQVVIKEKSGTLALTSDVTDTKVSTAAVTSGTTYYPVVGSNTTAAATKYYDSTGITYAGTNGTANGTNGNALLALGNSTASTSANWKKGTVRLYGTTAYYTDLVSGAPTTNRTITFPNATGTVALTSDIPTVPDVSGKVDTAGTGLSKSGTTLNHSNSVSAQTTQAVYPIKIDAQGHISAYGSSVTIPTITLNGSSTTSPSFYAPTSVGTSGYYLKSNGSGAPTWTAFPTIPTVPSAGTSASAVGTSSSGGSATTWSRSDHVHNITSATITSALGFTPVSTDTKNTAGSTDTSSKIFLIGATSQAANPQTYSHDTAYVGTDGKLYSASKVVLTGGSNAASAVTISPTTTAVYSMTSAGSVTTGTAASFTRGTFSQGTLPTMIWAMDTTDTKQLNITFSQGTLPTHAADSFTANTPTAVTLPGRSSAINAWTGYNTGVSNTYAAAQTFTGTTA